MEIRKRFKFELKYTGHHQKQRNYMGCYLKLTNLTLIKLRYNRLYTLKRRKQLI